MTIINNKSNLISKGEYNIMVTILNTSILTAEGDYKMRKISLSEAKRLVSGEFQSAVGHQATAEILTSLLGRDIKMNRILYKQQEGETALVFKLIGRPEEGKILTLSEIEAMGYEFYSLKRVSSKVWL